MRRMKRFTGYLRDFMARMISATCRLETEGGRAAALESPPGSERHSLRETIPELVLTVGPNTDFNVDLGMGQQTHEPTFFFSPHNQSRRMGPISTYGNSFALKRCSG